jgi:hypothetical protein
MVSPPAWFLRELKTVDPNYYVVANEEARVYRIMMNSDVVVESPMRGAFRITGPKTVDVFQHLNADALMHLRYRKWLGRQMKIIENPQNELAFLMAQEKAAKAKEMNLAHEMMAEGLQEGYRIDRKHSVS